jgi:hypothetical protein
MPTLYLVCDFGGWDIPADWFDALPALALVGGMIGAVLAAVAVEVIMIHRKPPAAPPTRLKRVRGT